MEAAEPPYLSQTAHKAGGWEQDLVSVSPAKSHADGDSRLAGPRGSLPGLGEPRLRCEKILISKVAGTEKG